MLRRESSKAWGKLWDVAVILNTQGREISGCTPLPDMPPTMPAAAVLGGSNPDLGVTQKQLPAHDPQHTTSTTTTGGNGTVDLSSHNDSSASSSTSSPGLQIQLESVSFAYTEEHQVRLLLI